jgi:tetratricopeptide (TPR) repeat protein
MSIWKSLQERGVWRNLVLYVGVSWGLVQGADFFVSRYQLTDALVDLLLLALIGLLPLAMWMSWKLGGPEDQRQLRWPGGMMCTGYVLCLAAGLIWGFADRGLGRATVEVETVDAEGASVVRERPRQDLIRALAIMPFAIGDAKSPDWLGMATATTLQTDLSQHRFLNVSTPIGTALRNAYLQNRANVPLSLQADEARRAGAGFFVSGKVSGSLDRLSVNIELHRVQPLKKLHSVRIENKPLLDLIDELSVALKPHLDLDAERADGDNDLPVVELLGSNNDALTAFFIGDYAMMMQDNYAQALAHAQRALELDPGFALAGLRIAQFGQAMGQFEAAKAGISAAAKNLYRLTQTQQCIVRVYEASYANASERAIRIAKSCADMYPNDVAARSMYGSILAMTPDTLDESIEQFEAVYALGPANDDALLQLARLKSMTGDEEGALSALTRYREAHPEETSTATQTSELMIRKGDLHGAEEVLRDAMARRESANLVSSLANVLMRQGRFDDAEAALAGYAPTSASETIAIETTRASALVGLGRESEALRKYDAAIAQAPEGLGNQFALARVTQFAAHFMRKNGIADIDRELARLIPANDDISRQSRNIYRAVAVLHSQDVALLRDSARAVQDFVVGSKRDDLQYLQMVARARQLDAEGRGSEAATEFSKAYELMFKSPSRLIVGESQLLRWWISSAARGASAAAVAPAVERLQRSFPGHPSALVALAEQAQRQGDIDQARSLNARALSLLDKADPDFPALLSAQRLQQQL